MASGAAQGQCETGPVVKRRINDFVAAEAPVGVGQRNMAHFTAPAFNEGNGKCVRGGRRDLNEAEGWR